MLSRRFLLALVFLFTILLWSRPSRCSAYSLQQTYDFGETGTFNLRFDGVTDTEYGTQFSVITGDLNNNGREDLLIGSAHADYNSRTDSGSVWVIYDDLLAHYSGTDNTIDLADSSSYSIRFDGAAANQGLGCSDGGQAIVIADLNGNGKNDLIFSANFGPAGGLSLAHPGWVYVLYDSLIETFTTSGTTVDLSTAGTYNLRYTAQALYDSFGTDIIARDINGNGKLDLTIAAHMADERRGNAGALYVIYDSLIDDYSGTGNSISLATTSNYNLRYDGPAASAYCGRALSEDLNNNGKLDLVFSCYGATFSGRASAGITYVIYDSLIDDYSSTGNNIDLATAANYNLSYGGAAATAYLGATLASGDLDGDAKVDLVLAATLNSPNSRTFAGSVYLIRNSLIDDYNGVGNNIDLNTTTNFNSRYDGGTTIDVIGTDVQVAEFDGENGVDLLISCQNGDYNALTNSGSVYLISNSLVASYTGTGNTINLATSSNYTLRYDGAAENDSVGSASSINGDLNNDGLTDLLITTTTTDYNSRTNSGSIYVVYNDAPTPTLGELDSYLANNLPTLTGSLTTNTEKLAGVEISFDNGDWVSGSSGDGSFDSLEESWTYTAALAYRLTEGSHTVRVRGINQKGQYTYNGSYAESEIVIDTLAPSEFDLLSPFDQEELDLATTPLPTFTWSEAQDAHQAERYCQLYIDDALVEDNIRRESWTLSDLQVADFLAYHNPEEVSYLDAPNVHTWYVTCFDDAGNDRSSTSTFTLTIVKSKGVRRPASQLTRADREILSEFPAPTQEETAKEKTVGSLERAAAEILTKKWLSFAVVFLFLIAAAVFILSKTKNFHH